MPSSTHDNSTIFAQVCTTTSAVVKNTATVFELVSTDGATPVGISSNDFITQFYSSSNGVFKFNTTDCSCLLLDFTGDAAYTWNVLGVSGIVLTNIVRETIESWESDLNVTYECWEPCSYMTINRELYKGANLCHTHCNESNVCCSMSALELATYLNALDIEKGVSPTPIRTATAPVNVDDLVTLSVRFTNDNPNTKPVEFHLNFIIVE